MYHAARRPASGNLPRGVDNTAHDGDQQKLTEYMIL